MSQTTLCRTVGLGRAYSFEVGILAGPRLRTYITRELQCGLLYICLPDGVI